ncbi:MAG: hypothetical protein WCT41_02355 [Candidatus Paceibacterota bacterium]|jgi:hypothetical protein
MGVKIYCDNNVLPTWLRLLEKSDSIKIIQFPYENVNKKIKNKGVPTDATWNQMKLTWNQANFIWNDQEPSDKYNSIISILQQSSQNTKVDAQHLDSAYKSNCSVFITNDKTDILSRRLELKNLLGIDVCAPDEARTVVESKLL